MTKIVHVLFSAKLGGAEQVVINISRGLSGSYDFTYCSQSGSIQESLQAVGIAYQSFSPKQLLKFRRAILALQPDIIHAHDFKASFLVNLPFHQVPIITHIHQAPIWQTSVNWKSLAFQYIGNKSSRVLYVSDWAKESYRFHKHLTNTAIIPNGIDSSRICQLATASTTIAFDLLFVGRLEDVKDPVRFVRIAHKLLDTIPELKIGIVGDGSLSAHIAKQIAATPQIRWLGFKSNPYKYMRHAKVVLSTSKSDAFGLTMVEAALLGAIPFAPRIGGLSQTAARVNGIVYASDDELLAVLTRLFSDDPFYQATKAKIAAVDFSDYEQRRFIQRIQQVYEGVMER
ncbi:MAG: glycosyltransferase [Lactiplantibacillus plantarum]